MIVKAAGDAIGPAYLTAFTPVSLGGGGGGDGAPDEPNPKPDPIVPTDGGGGVSDWASHYAK